MSEAERTGETSVLSYASQPALVRASGIRLLVIGAAVSVTTLACLIGVVASLILDYIQWGRGLRGWRWYEYDAVWFFSLIAAFLALASITILSVGFFKARVRPSGWLKIALAIDFLAIVAAMLLAILNPRFRL